jgi:hypothetical protein
MIKKVHEKTHGSYIKRLKKSIERNFKLYEVARIMLPIRPITDGQSAVIKMIAISSDKIMRKHK